MVHQNQGFSAEEALEKAKEALIRVKLPAKILGNVTV